MVLTIHVDPFTINCRKVVAGLDMMGTDYKVEKLSYFTDLKKPEFLKINPMGTIPAATDGGLTITESNAILMYAADLSGEKGAVAYPKDLKIRANVNRWLLWESCSWFPTCYNFLVQHAFVPKPDAAIIEAETVKFHKMAAILDQQLGKTKFLVGDNPTIADIAVMAPIHVHPMMNLPYEKYKNLQRWIADIEAIPAWKKSGEVVTATFNAIQEGQYVRSELNYTKDKGDQLTEIYFYEDEHATNVNPPGDDPKEVAIHDGWSRKDEFSEDVHGFSFHEFKSTYPQDAWADDARVQKQFYPEVVEFLKKTIGAKRVLVFDHTIRTKANEAKKLTDEKATSQRAPVRLVHCDYTAESGPLRVKQLLPDEADTLLASRVAFINVWKPLAKVEELPLTMCDVTSSPPEDFFKLFLRYRDRTGENYLMRYSDAHKWYYFPNMTPDQCILLKTYESDETKARFVGHTAFADPTSKPDAPTRESIEIRTIAFF
ncbi:glutathione s-transferase [Acrodontium crateriforme]|uniref:Glutathione s-transferase n=1 Tax=Acrodontium crateriforme TaxID=150365 RepID=A0AAQ3RBA7_9PEZI|nr:glutathione s-transferase [Acrodontium crateriforme]